MATPLAMPSESDYDVKRYAELLTQFCKTTSRQFGDVELD